MPGTDEPVELPDGYGYWTRPATGPSWSTAEVAQVFYGMDYDDLLHWLSDERIWLDLDGRRIEWASFASGNKRWRLYDVERAAHAMTTAGRMSLARLARTVGIVKLVGQQHGVAVEFQPLRVSAADRRALLRHPRVRARPNARFPDAITGEPGARPRRLALGENELEIDLTDAHWAEVISALATVTAHARVLFVEPRTYHATRAERTAIREWGRAHGYRVSERGLISAEVLTAYRRAMEED